VVGLFVACELGAEGSHQPKRFAAWSLEPDAWLRQAALAGWGCKLVQALVDDDLADEYRLTVFPCVLGAGKRLFADTTGAAVLALAETRTLGNDGVILLIYRPKSGRSNGVD
jgi:dihydrofolate reductase